MYFIVVISFFVVYVCVIRIFVIFFIYQLGDVYVVNINKYDVYIILDRLQVIYVVDIEKTF